MRSSVSFILAGLLAVPASVFALNYADNTSQYSDASSLSRAEKAAVSVLTDLGAVSGNDDGTFAPGRTLNRAEFLKIALLSVGNLTIPEKVESCFGDVKANQWFAPYVCFAKQKGAVKGYPSDGLFHPEREVNYAEALKMLGELFGVTSDLQEGEEWFSAYARAANERGLLLPMTLPFDRFLTRGQMARLAASYRADAEGELDLYRKAEQGKNVSSSASSSQAQWATCPDGYQYQTHADDGSQINYFADPCLNHYLSSSSSSVSSAAASSASSVALYPARGHFLLPGSTTPVLLDAQFTSPDEDGDVRFVTVRLRQEVKSLSGLTLVDASGKALGQLQIATDDPTKMIWKGDFATPAVRLQKGVATRLGITGTLKKDGSVSLELFDTAEFYLQMQGVMTATSRQLQPTDYHYPMHQTALARIYSVRNAGEASGTLTSGNKRLIGSFAFSGSITSTLPRLQDITFKMQKSGMSLSNFKIGGNAEIEQAACGVDSGDPTILSCSLIPEAVNTVNGTRVISVFADVAVQSDGASLQLSLEEPGRVGVAGAVRWTDSSGSFSWIEGEAPLAKGTVWKGVK